MDYVILDLEWNGCYSKKLGGYINEIIEFGAVKLNENLEIIDQFSMLVKPEICRRIRSSVKELTSITNEDLKNGVPFNYAVSKFKKFAKNCLLMTWSTSDLVSLEANCSYYLGQPKIPFLQQYVDLQAYCQDMMGIKRQSSLGLVAAAELLGLDVDDIPHHRAVGDSIVSAKCLKELYFKPVFESYIQDADDEEFYQRLNFRNTYISHLENSTIDKSEMFFNCAKCGARTMQKTDWEAKNKAFTAVFQCPYCDYQFKGRIQFKVRYHEITVIKKVLAVKKAEEPQRQSES